MYSIEKGEPVEVIGVYPQGERTVYKVTLTDGRSIECSGDHLWNYKSSNGNGAKRWKTVTTKELMGKNLALRKTIVLNMDVFYR